MSSNSNLLQGWECPECGNVDIFHAEVSGVATITDNGLEMGDTEYSADSCAECGECHEFGIVETFSGGAK